MIRIVSDPLSGGPYRTARTSVRVILDELHVTVTIMGTIIPALASKRQPMEWSSTEDG